MQGRPGPSGLQGMKGEKGSQVNNKHWYRYAEDITLWYEDMNFLSE